ncbi:hypothetical protein SCLCIDRAFT_581732 [Scleroderma citrinum Foug A]|uniref:Uncharacterized protein n=1 Tax=Scleroderma citrinum Foug A TaxID=1036808 RepID=A0A0C3AJ86_9AGAM|nr:hypothetical protein SCLCIDRAFT_581732 [Scleroderma citrinum Foug A]
MHTSVDEHDSLPSEPPRLDPGPLTMSGNPEPVLSDETLKVNIVPDNFNEETPALAPEINVPDENTRDPSKRHRGRPLQVVKAEGVYLWQLMKRYLFHPGGTGCLIGLVNTAVIGTVAYFGYIKWDLPRWNRRIVASVSMGLFALLGAER